MTRVGIGRRTGLIVVLGGIGVVSCGGKPDEYFQESPNCPQTAEELQAQILAPSCGDAGCHGATAPALSLDLASPNLTARLVNTAANGCGDKRLVVPGHPEQSYLLVKVSEAEPECGDRMPLGSTLPQAQSACIAEWVRSLPVDGGGGTPGAGGANSSGGTSSSAGGSTSGSGGDSTMMGGALNSMGGNLAATGGVTNSGGEANQSSGGFTSSMGGILNSVGGSGGVSSSGGTSTTGAQPNNGGSGAIGGKTGMGGSANTAGAVSTGGQPTVCSGVVFSTDVQPIFTNSCTSSGCHTGTRPAAKLALNTGAAYAELVNVAASSCSARILVKPGDVASSYLVDKLLGRNLCFGSQMPKAGSSLPSAQLAAIQGWICEGAPNN